MKQDISKVKNQAAPLNEFVNIVSYKHNGEVHRIWDKAFVTAETKDYIVAITNRAWVVESNGQRWLTREPAVCFYYKKRWFNVIAMIRRKGIFFYCNLASPSFYDGEAIKNIDYDLDIKFFPNGSYQILDEDEFQRHAEKMNYPKQIEKKLRKEIDWLIKTNLKLDIPFSKYEVLKHYDIYEDYIEDKANHKVKLD